MTNPNNADHPDAPDPLANLTDDEREALTLGAERLAGALQLCRQRNWPDGHALAIIVAADAGAIADAIADALTPPPEEEEGGFD
jgi:hypothetical protein